MAFPHDSFKDNVFACRIYILDFRSGKKKAEFDEYYESEHDEDDCPFQVISFETFYSLKDMEFLNM
jgi:hypothetical protein